MLQVTTTMPNVQWHDGKPFTADDVVFNWEYATDPATAALFSPFVPPESIAGRLARRDGHAQNK